MNTRLLLVLMALLLATATLITAQSSSSTGGTGQECGWQVGQGFTECSVTCGNGTYERELICVDATTFEQQNDTTCCGPFNGQVEEFPCNLGECDDTASSSSSTGGTDTSSSTGSSSTGGTGQECEWQVGQGFTECSETCGTGVFTRELICFDQEANEETEDTSCCGTYDGGPLDYWACNLGPCPGDDDGSEPSNDTQTEGCEWQIGRGFTPCSVSCGPGVYSRELVCFNHDNDTYVNDTSCCGEYSGGPLYYWTCNLGNCDTNTSEPEEPQSGANETCTWWEDGYTECSVSCGYGVFTRTWICVLDGETQNDTACCGENDNEVEYWSCFSGECQADNGTSSGPGNSTDNSTCTWQYDGFTECSTSCGPGVFTNALVCVLDNTTLSDVTCCGDYTGPVEYWACNLGACDDDSPSVPQGEGCEWQVGQGFTECSETCGDGTYTRELICYNYDTDSVETDTTCCGEFEGRVDEWACNLGECDDGSVPQSEPSCSSDDDEECEEYLWVYSEFGNCSATCNTSVAYRKVLCLAPDWTIATDDQCTDERPEEEEECQIRACEDDEEPESIETPEADFEWLSSNWTECSVTCGIGHQTRRTICISSNNTEALNEDCDDADRPECDATCQLAPCEEENPPSNGTQSYHNKFTRLRKLFKRN